MGGDRGNSQPLTPALLQCQHGHRQHCIISRYYLVMTVYSALTPLLLDGEMEAGPVTRDTRHVMDTRQGRGILPHQHGDYILRLKRPTWSCENIRKKKTISCKSRHYPLSVRPGCVLPACCLRSAAVSVIIEGLLLCAV